MIVAVATLFAAIGLIAVLVGLISSFAYTHEPARDSTREKVLLGSRDIALFCLAVLIALLITHLRA